MARHTEECSHQPAMQPVACTFPGCEEKVRQMDLQKHVQECKFHPDRQLLPCAFPACGYQGVREDMAKHYSQNTNDHFAQYLCVWAEELSQQKALAATVKQRREEAQRLADKWNAEDVQTGQALEQKWKAHAPTCGWNCKPKGPFASAICKWGPIQRQWQEAQNENVAQRERAKGRYWRYHPSMHAGLCTVCHMDADADGCVTLGVFKKNDGPFHVAAVKSATMGDL
jgi:hypothetical protein